MFIVGTIKSIIFHNEENSYTVLQVETDKAVFTLCGNIVDATPGVIISAEVNEVYSKNYGTQYKVINYTLKMPESADSIEKYLSSKDFKGIGKSLAKRLVNIFGDNTINVILDSPDQLIGIKGLTNDKINTLHNVIKEKANEIKLIIELGKYGLSVNLIKKIIDEYGDESEQIIKTNPYLLALNIDGIGFMQCDKIAKMNGYDEYSSKRIEASILFVLEREYASGNVYLTSEKLIELTNDLLKLKEDFDFKDALYNLAVNLLVVIYKFNGNDIVFLKRAYGIENKLSNMLYERREDILIITGGPGTGKTYNIKKYLKEAENSGYIVDLCAPTGRAAKRMSEVTDYPAKTIHRLLECRGKKGDKIEFYRNRDNQLESDVIIIDEMSMVDEFLLLHLMEAIPEGSKIILVGDVDQLPSVGAGQVLKDMIESNIFKVQKLTTIHRQAEGSNIVVNAHLVNSGATIDLRKKVDDFKFIHMSSVDKINSSIIKLVKENIPKYFNIDNDQIQVLCASKIGECGTENLNIILQESLNEESIDKPEITVGKTILRLNDKVMQTANNYDVPYDLVNKDNRIIDKDFGVFNGDIGRIIDIDEEEKNITVRYDDRIAYYDSKMINDLTLAYAITVHKSQGSEYDVCVMPMVNVPYQLMYRKILYTAITRAKKCFCLIGYEEVFDKMKNNVWLKDRTSALCSSIFLKTKKT